jgi:NADH/NAD ratio-sensing transcriptional regulator Rex
MDSFKNMDKKQQTIAAVGAGLIAAALIYYAFSRQSQQDETVKIVEETTVTPTGRE